jgi:hypothetical protein
MKTVNATDFVMDRCDDLETGARLNDCSDRRKMAYHAILPFRRDKSRDVGVA